MKKIIYFMASVAMTVYMAVSTGITAWAAEEEIDTSIEKGEELYQNFLDATAFIENDSTWEKCLGYYGENGIMKITLRDCYLEDVAGATEENYAELSAYETFIYLETYVHFSSMVGNGMTQRYIENERGGVSNYIDLYCINWTGNNAEEVIEVYREFVEWQFAYFREHNFPYNFITGRTYAEETGLFPVEEESEDSGLTEQEIQNELGLTEEEIQEIANALTKEEVEEIKEAAGESEKETSPWGAVIEKLASMWFTLLVLAVFVVAYLVVRHMRKKTDIDELSDGGR